MPEPIKIAVCDRRYNEKYKNQERPWEYIVDRNRKPIRTTETVEEYAKMTREQRTRKKDHGGFVGGWLRDGLRQNGHVIGRWIGALDADHIPKDVDFFGLTATVLAGVTYFLYSSHSHRPEAPRYRIVFPLSREVSEDEYPALMRMIARQFGLDYIDEGSYEATRMMFWASCPSNGEFIFDEKYGEPLDPDKYLDMYDDWRDVTQWPISSHESEVHKRTGKSQQDPLAKRGVIGAFCTAYPIEDAINEFLSDVYEPAVVEGRYQYTKSESTAGVVIYDDKFAYSHHASDPACGKLLNAFDLVKTHKFSDLDEKKSLKAMLDFAISLDRVKLEFDAQRQAQAQSDFDTEAENWKTRLKYMPRSSVLENSVWNEILILNHDPDFANFAYNEMAYRIQVTGEMPWDRPEHNKYWRDADTAQLKALLDVRYVTFSSRKP